MSNTTLIHSSLATLALMTAPAGCVDSTSEDPPALTQGESAATQTDSLDPTDSSSGDSSGMGRDTEPGDTEPGESTGEPSEGVPVLGNLGHSLDDVVLEVILATQLSNPTDVELSPHNPTELWVTNRGDNSITIIVNAGPDQTVHSRSSAFGGSHFLAKPAAIAFGAPGFMATAQQEDQATQPTTPADFMGPTLWPSDIDLFDGGDASHLDMLHDSPNSSGIAWEADNIYWVFDGAHGSLTRYDFQSDHGPAGMDHTDGRIYRALDGELAFVPGVAAHIAYDHDTNTLYAVDPGHKRIIALDARSGKLGPAYGPSYDGGTQNYIVDTSMTTWVDGSDLEIDMSVPSGLELHDGMVFVTDNETSTISAFSMDGRLVDWLDTGWPASTLMGLTFDEEGRMYVVDSAGDRVLRISAKD